MKPLLKLALALPLTLVAHAQTFTVLKPADYTHYDALFVDQEKKATGTAPDTPWPWMESNIPLFDSSDKHFEEMYYFRWYAWQKHLVHTPKGYIITEWLPKPEATDGAFGALPDAMPFHLGEARWLRDPHIAADDARYWLSPTADPRKYSVPAADSILRVTLATGDTALSTDLLPAMIANYQAWVTSNQDANGLFWQIDTRDAMEKSISGDGYRPPLNSYMAADALAIAALARLQNKLEIAQKYSELATQTRTLIEQKLWNPKDNFYEVMSPSKDSGIRKQKKFIDPGTNLQLSNVRELIGYIPWQFNLPPVEHAIAWQTLEDPKGFGGGKYGATTAERRSPRFRFESSDQCTWNGPTWPYATTQTLLGLANLLNGPAQTVIGKPVYYRLFSEYVFSQHQTLKSGETIDWIDEDQDADTGEWIAKNMLIAKNKQVGRGNYYNHSGFADMLITGLLGLRPQLGDTVSINPLLPGNTWQYFALDGLPYHGHILAIVYDATGKHYNKGRGLTLFVDGKKLASRPTLGPLEATLKH